MVDISNNLVDIWFFFWWSIFDKTPLAALDTFRVLLCCLGQLINVQALWSVPPQNEPFISENCWWFKSQNDDKITKNLSFTRLFARIFAKIAPVFLQKWDCLKNWEHCILCSWQAMILAIIEFSFEEMFNSIFFNPTDATRVAGSPRIGVGPGFDSQGSVNFFNKYCFPNLHWIHVKALEVEDCEVVPVSVHHHNVLILQEFYSCRLDFERRCPARDNCGYSTTRFPQSTTLFFACPYQPWVDFRSFANFKLYFRCLFDRH